jgi:hypothetical protein
MSESQPPRHDIYGPIHKAIRGALADLMVRLGRADFNDDGVMFETLASLRAQLRFSAAHLRHEEEHVHTALAARAAEAVELLERDHAGHHVAFDLLQRAIAEVEAAPSDARGPAARHLYLAFSVFVAEDLDHMAREERLVGPLLHDLFIDAELQAMEAAIIASMPPEEAMAALARMIVALNPDERLALLRFVRATAPAEVFSAVLEVAARPVLPANDWADLAARLDLAA